MNDRSPGLQRRRDRTASVALLLCLLTLCGALPSVGQDDVAWGISELSGTDASLPTGDLAGLFRAVGDARIVGLGESFHTSGGFYRAKERVIRALVEERGFRAFALETPWSAAGILNQYVQTCSGSAATAVNASMFPVWAGEAMRDLAVWMCEWNRRNPNQRVVAFGFDVQQPNDDFIVLDAFLRSTQLDVPEAVEAIDQCYVHRVDAPRPDRIESCLAALAALRGFFESRERELINERSLPVLEELRIRELGLRAWQEQISLPSPRNSEARDAAMAEVFEYQRDRLARGAKAIVWAHNAHITRHPRGAFFRAMGHWLAKRHGSDYQPIALFAEEVFIDWAGVGCGGPFFEHEPGDLEDVLGALGADLFVDFSRLSNDHPVLRGCTPYAFSNRDPEVLVDHFEGAIFLEVSPPMDYLQSFRTCGAKSTIDSSAAGAPELRQILAADLAGGGTPARRTVDGCQRPVIDSLTTDSTDPSSISLTWQSRGVTTGHTLERWRGARRELAVDLPVDATAFADSDLVVGVSYRYVVTGGNRYGVADSVETVATTEPPNLSPCVTDPETLCLGGDRFEVRATWTTASDEGAARVAAPGTEDSGVLWFFAEDNWEMLVKVLDGCSVNDHHWVLSTATTDVGYELQIRDTTNGAVGRYSNALGSSAEAIIDTRAFSNCTSKPDQHTTSLEPESALSTVVAGAAQRDTCTPTDEILCLQDGRIQVETSWDDGRGNSGRGFVAPIIDRSSGLFWFFDTLNWEILIKVLDGCAINGHRWVFFGGTTDVELTVTVTDLETSEQKIYRNEGGTPANTVTDTRALVC